MAVYSLLYTSSYKWSNDTWTDSTGSSFRLSATKWGTDPRNVYVRQAGVWMLLFFFVNWTDPRRNDVAFSAEWRLKMRILLMKLLTVVCFAAKTKIGRVVTQGECHCCGDMWVAALNKELPCLQT